MSHLIIISRWKLCSICRHWYVPSLHNIHAHEHVPLLSASSSIYLWNWIKIKSMTFFYWLAKVFIRRVDYSVLHRKIHVNQNPGIILFDTKRHMQIKVCWFFPQFYVIGAGNTVNWYHDMVMLLIIFYITIYYETNWNAFKQQQWNNFK